MIYELWTKSIGNGYSFFSSSCLQKDMVFYIIHSWAVLLAMAPASVRRGASWPAWYFSTTAVITGNKMQKMVSFSLYIICFLFKGLENKDSKHWLSLKLKRSKETSGLLSQPPMCFPPINTLGTVLRPVHSAKAKWMSLPSPSNRNTSKT